MKEEILPNKSRKIFVFIIYSLFLKLLYNQQLLEHKSIKLYFILIRFRGIREIKCTKKSKCIIFFV
jgi:hypothetical protein